MQVRKEIVQVHLYLERVGSFIRQSSAFLIGKNLLSLR